jgi:hypothetical protein
MYIIIECFEVTILTYLVNLIQFMPVLNQGGLFGVCLMAIECSNALLMGVYLSKRVKTAEHYYLGDRTTPW